MAYDIENRLVVGLASSALFDLDQGGGGGGAGGSDGDEDGTQTLKPVPRGEAICIRFIIENYSFCVAFLLV